MKRTMTKTIRKKVEFDVHENGLCCKVFIPRKYCTIVLKGCVKDYLEQSINGKDIEIENLSDDVPCQKILTKDIKDIEE